MVLAVQEDGHVWSRISDLPYIMEVVSCAFCANVSAFDRFSWLETEVEAGTYSIAWSRGDDVYVFLLFDALRAMGYSIRLEKLGLPTLEEMQAFAARELGLGEN